MGASVLSGEGTEAGQIITQRRSPQRRRYRYHLFPLQQITFNIGQHPFRLPDTIPLRQKTIGTEIAVSLGLSWVLALTQTTTFGNFILKDKTDQAGRDPYDTKFYNGFSWVLIKLIRFKVLTVVIVVLLFIASLVVMGLMPQNFFPNMDKPYFRADCFLPEAPHGLMPPCGLSPAGWQPVHCRSQQ